MRTLLVDNYDSYTFNLFQLIAQVNGTEPVVVANDDPLLIKLSEGAFDNIVISPGPGRPQRSRDIGFVADLLRGTELPVLGVCLGHQAIAHQAGAQVGPAPQPRHGYLSQIEHHGDDLFAGVPAEFTAVRYHSLRVEEPLPEALAATAWAEDGVIMAVRHRELPRWGVQFHPESIAAQYGREILANFGDLTGRARRDLTSRALRDLTGRARRRGGGTTRGTGTTLTTALETSGMREPGGGPGDARQRYANPSCAQPASPGRGRHADPSRGRYAGPSVGLRLIAEAVHTPVNTETLFAEFFGSSPTCFWLDSSLVQAGLSRFSFLGDGSGPLSETLTYRVGDAGVEIRDASGVRMAEGGAFDVLERRLSELRMPTDPGLPFEFTAGYVGYVGYEMKADCGADAAHCARTPDAMWIFADRLIVVDHETGVTYLLACHDGSDGLHAAARGWVDQIARRLTAMAAPTAGPGDGLASSIPADPDGYGPWVPADRLVRDQDSYQADVQECRRQLILGESYEICLTNRLHLPFDDDDLAFYLRLRRANPAPYAALLRGAGITVYSSSPERFLRIDRDGRVESKPIKGTAPRHPDPAQDARIAEELATSAKTRAENLMIVDLLRNDLGQLCEIGSVTVGRYMAVESYATVHQLVTTISGQLKPTVSVVECVRRCFPGGSMTGAPKLRTMEIIDRLETEARGVYSGALGYFGLSGGADLSIVIRAAVRQRDTLSIGAGGAIVLDSSPQGEYEEMLLKAATPLRAYRPVARAGSVRSSGSGR
ncbi:MAG TPA: aminodeoxychorismate synthase component I [Streptosporangiaceae bacterium]